MKVVLALQHGRVAGAPECREAESFDSVGEVAGTGDEGRGVGEEGSAAARGSECVWDERDECPRHSRGGAWRS
jgi:hypothetical protein